MVNCISVNINVLNRAFSEELSSLGNRESEKDIIIYLPNSVSFGLQISVAFALL